ncbi:MAG: PAS domain-containing protein [candidate division Zixibacteria bacterium]|nr:PAS domain-containing protein [candidate division Zixibacteria bacterium]
MSKRRIFWRLYPSYIILIVISILAVSWFSLRSQRQLHLEQTATNLEARALLVQSQLASRILEEDFNGVDSLCKELGQISSTRITVILPSGIVIGDSEEDPGLMENHCHRPEIEEAFQTGRGKQIRYSSTVKQRLMYKAILFESDNQQISVIRTAIPVTFIDKALSSAKIRVFIDGTIIAILAAMLGLYVSRRLSNPLERLKKGAQRFASGNLQHKMLLEGNTVEIDALAEAINDMAEQLGQRITTITNQRSEQEAILHSMVEGVIAVDTEANIINFNQAAAEFFNLNKEDVTGKPLYTAIRSTLLQEAVDKTLQHRKSITREVVFTEGETRITEITVSQLRGAGGHQIGALIVVNDISRMRHLEKIRRDFVANVSHELKTPITSIHGFVETLKDGAIENKDDAYRFLDIILKQSERLQAIIEDILSLARIEQSAEEEKIELSQCDLAPIMRDAIDSCEQMAATKNIRLELAANADISAVVNPRLLEQAVINLIMNAITYSDPDSVVMTKINEFADEVTIAVIDTGTGIAKEHHGRLFERFYRVDKARSREYGGTGLGLAIVKHITLALNGSIQVESVLGKGSTFIIGLPR